MARFFYFIFLRFSTHFIGAAMRKLIITFLLLLQGTILSQINFIEQITSGDFDAGNPFIYEDEYFVFSRSVYFEIHINGTSNIYFKKYNQAMSMFDDTVAVTHSNSLNINPFYDPSVGVIFQTNRNGNWDIGLVKDSAGIIDIERVLTSSPEDETQPVFFKKIWNYESVFSDSTKIICKKNSDIIFINYEHNQVNEEVVFGSDSTHIYTEFCGLEISPGFQDEGYYIFAVELDSQGRKSLVFKRRSFDGTIGPKNTIMEHCDCSDLVLDFSNFSEMGLFFTDTLQNEKRIKVLENPYSTSSLLFTVPIAIEGNLSEFDKYNYLMITDKGTVTPAEPELFMPYTFLTKNDGVTRVRLDPSDLGLWGYDSLVNISLSDPKLIIGSVGVENNMNLIYTIWEDSIDGHMQLFGAAQHRPYGAVEDESVANDFLLYQNYPNPFNPATKIEYKLLQASDVKFNVFNILGEKVFERNYGYQTSGSYKVSFDGKNLPSGVYVYSIYTDKNRLSRKMMMIK